MMAIALAGALPQISAQEKTDVPSYTATVKIDDV
jgi:hypothetical protein